VLSLSDAVVGGIAICDLRRGTTRKLQMPVSASDFPLSWRADGRQLIFLGGDALGFGADHKPFLVGVESGEVKRLAGDAPWYWDGVVLSPEGRRLALLIQWRYPTGGTEPEQLAVLHTATSKMERAVGSRQVGQIDALSWSPDGRKIVFTVYRHDDHGDLYVVDLATKRIATLVATNAGERQPAWSPDGTRIAYERSPPGRPGETSIWVVDLATGARDRVTRGSSDLAPGWSPDGARIAFVRRG
jgi:Tol biopolymer transport system component